MKIALSGVQCAGKSTLLNILLQKDEFKNFSFIYEVVRNLKDKIKINEDGDENTQMVLMNHHIENLKNYSDAVYDRCLLDCYAYTLWMYRNGKISLKVKDEILEKYKDNINSYDVIFYIRPEFDLVADGVRSMNTQFRNETLECFEELILGLSNIVILTGSIDDRMKQIERWYHSNTQI